MILANRKGILELATTFMIRLPEFVDEAMFNKAVEVALNKKRNELLFEVCFALLRYRVEKNK